MAEREIVIVGAMRTPIGSFGGALKEVDLITLATTACRGALERSGTPADAVGHVVMGNVIPTEPRDGYLARVAAVDAGIPLETPAFNVNRLCGSGLQAVISAAQSILLGDTDVAIGGGAESMSRGPFILPNLRWGARLGDSQAIDYMNTLLHDPWGKFHMGVTAENVAERYGINRAQQDALALESQQRAVRAIESGRFREQIVPVEVTTRKGSVLFDTDEHPRADLTAERLAALKPIFKKDNGSVTAGNASASMMVLLRWCWLKPDGRARWGSSPWLGWLGMPMRAWTRPTWASARCPPCARCWSAPESASIRLT